VKIKGRGTPPSLRLSVPDEAVKKSQSGADRPTADGWQHLWLRTELKAAAKPKYLAVWMQGPGTVWVDELSLRTASAP